MLALEILGVNTQQGPYLDNLIVVNSTPLLAKLDGGSADLLCRSAALQKVAF